MSGTEPASSGSNPRNSFLVVSGWLLLAFFSLGAACMGDITEHARRFVLLYAIGSVGYVLLVVAYRRIAALGRRGAAGLLIGAALLRLPLLVLPCTDDVSRYLWEGRVQLAGHNPYAVPPDDPRLALLRDENWKTVNHPGYTAIYPPFTMATCALVASLWQAQLAFKLLHVFADVAAIALLIGWLRREGKPAGLAAIYGLCPLTLTAFAGEGHNDSLMIAAMAGAGYALACGRKWTGAFLLGAAMSFKLVALLAWPWLLRRHPRASLLAIGLLAFSFVPYLGAGSKLFDSLARFGTGKTLLSFYHGTLPAFLERWSDDPARLVLGISGMILIGAATWAALRCDFGGAAKVAMAVLLLASPVVHYWYLTWVLAFVAFRFGWAWIAAAAAMGLYFQVGVSLARTGQWLMPHWVGWVFWGTLLLTCPLERFLIRNTRRTSQ